MIKSQIVQRLAMKYQFPTQAPSAPKHTRGDRKLYLFAEKSILCLYVHTIKFIMLVVAGNENDSHTIH